jgi:hypothetical protein
MSNRSGRVVRGLSDLGGRGLAATFAAVGKVRPARKPLHPRGELFSAVVERSGLDAPVGVPWIDEPGRTTVLVRLSRATGLPPSLPDIHGMALRIPTDDAGHADILLATTGTGRISRFVLFPAGSADHGAYSTLIPYETKVGALNLAALPVRDEARTFALACARGTGKWRTFARMRLEDLPLEDSPSFDPVLNTLPGLAYYDWATRLRERAYRGARRSRDD